MEDLEKMLSAHIGSGKKILNTDISDLVAPGENYGGELSKIEISTEDETNQSKNVVHAVVKRIPPDDIRQQLFDVQNTFGAEIRFYEKIVPILQNFQKEQGVEEVIDCFAKFYGGRLNLNGSTTVDRDGLIIMENLIIAGYKNVNRFTGFNSEETEVLLKDLANLQATVLGLKLKNPDLFENDIRPFLCNQINGPENNPILKVYEIIEELLWNDDSAVPYISKVKKINKIYRTAKYEAREPFATFAHCDLWGNNIMIKHENGKPVGTKLVDFQIYNYKSPVIDLLNFLITSVQTNELKSNFDHFIKYYHSEFIAKLQQLGVNSEQFSYKHFEEELQIDAKRAFTWVFMFVPCVVFGNYHENANPDGNLDDPEIREQIKKHINPEAMERVTFMVSTFGKNGWLDTN